MSLNKRKSLSSRKEATGKRPWPNLPQQLLNLLAKKPNLLHQISYPGTTKSWSAPTRRCNGTKLSQHPQLHDLEGPNKWFRLRKTRQHFINIDIRPQLGYGWWIFYNRDPSPDFRHDPRGHFVGYSNGSLITRGPNPSHLHIFQLQFRGFETPPPWDINIPIKFAAIISYGSYPMVVVTGISKPAFLVCNRRYEWIKCECEMVDPYDAKKQTMQFNNIIGFGGKFYALSLQGALAVIEEIGSRFVVTSIGRSRIVPSVGTRYFKEHLLESNGEILLVFLICRKSLSVVDEVEVFRLHISKLEWVKVERFKEKALFLESECCIWVNSRQVGCRSNCVYFTQSMTNDQWFTYDMESGCISPGLVWNEPTLQE